MRYYLTAENENGKMAKVGGDEYLDIDIRVGNKHIAKLTLRDGKLYDEWDREISNEKCDWCKKPMYCQIRGHHHTEGGVDVTKGK